MLTSAAAEKLVLNHIKGTRVGSDEPAAIHSKRVGARLREYGYEEEVVIAGILHDAIEDSELTYTDLKNLGATQKTLELVQLCTHDAGIAGGDARWVVMIAGLVRAENPEAWAIKIADIWDNVISADTLSDERKRILRTSKFPMLIAASAPIMQGTRIWEDARSEGTSKWWK